MNAALMKQIQAGKGLKKTETVDKSAPLISGSKTSSTAASPSAGSAVSRGGAPSPVPSGPMGLGGMFAGGMMKPSEMMAARRRTSSNASGGPPPLRKPSDSSSGSTGPTANNIVRRSVATGAPPPMPRRSSAAAPPPGPTATMVSTKPPAPASGASSPSQSASNLSHPSPKSSSTERLPPAPPKRNLPPAPPKRKLAAASPAQKPSSSPSTIPRGAESEGRFAFHALDSLPPVPPFRTGANKAAAKASSGMLSPGGSHEPPKRKLSISTFANSLSTIPPSSPEQSPASRSRGLSPKPLPTTPGGSTAHSPGVGGPRILPSPKARAAPQAGGRPKRAPPPPPPRSNKDARRHVGPPPMSPAERVAAQRGSVLKGSPVAAAHPAVHHGVHVPPGQEDSSGGIPMVIGGGTIPLGMNDASSVGGVDLSPPEGGLPVPTGPEFLALRLQQVASMKEESVREGYDEEAQEYEAMMQKWMDYQQKLDAALGNPNARASVLASIARERREEGV